MIDCYAPFNKHYRHHIVDNSTPFKEKVERATQYVLDMLNANNKKKKTQRRTPQELCTHHIHSTRVWPINYSTLMSFHHMVLCCCCCCLCHISTTILPLPLPQLPKAIKPQNQSKMVGLTQSTQHERYLLLSFPFEHVVQNFLQL